MAKQDLPVVPAFYLEPGTSEVALGGHELIERFAAR